MMASLSAAANPVLQRRGSLKTAALTLAAAAVRTSPFIILEQQTHGGKK